MNEINSLIINDQLSIPAAELSFRFSTSSGPGGQHANRSATRVTLIFDVAQSPSLDGPTRERLLEELAPRLDKDGVLQIHVQDTRSQNQNRELAISRFISLLEEALIENKERIPTNPPSAARKQRVEVKKRRGQLKEERSRDWSENG